jgi:enoyl-CoA hydratase
MADRRFASTFGGRFLEEWTEVARMSKPIIAAVNGYAVSDRAQPVCVLCSWVAAVS